MTDSLVGTLILIFGCLLVISVFTGISSCTQNQQEQQKLVKPQLENLRLENEKLHLEIERLRRAE
jgi:cell division protein FtsB